MNKENIEENSFDASLIKSLTLKGIDWEDKKINVYIPTNTLFIDNDFTGIYSNSVEEFNNNIDRIIADNILYDIDILDIQRKNQNKSIIILYNKYNFKVVTIPDSVESVYLLGSYITNIYLPPTVKQFTARNTSLEKLNLPNQLKELTLINNPSLKKVDIPDSVNYINASPFLFTDDYLEKNLYNNKKIILNYNYI